MTTARLTTSTYLGTLACTIGFLFACYFPSPRAKLAISAPSLLGIIAVMVGRRQVVEDDRTASDIRAIQHQAMQSNLWHSLTAKPVNVSVGEARLEQQLALPASEELPTLAEGQYRQLINYSSVLVWGSQGSGKTSFVKGLLQRKQQAGQQIVILDPHAEKRQWGELHVIGAGMAYAAIDYALEAFHSEIKRRYKVLADGGEEQFEEVTVVCEEFTNWADRCENSGPFFKACLSDIRKIKLRVVFISHARTLSGLGGSKGMAKTRDNGLLELELWNEPDEYGEPKPAFSGTLKMPGKEAIAHQFPQHLYVQHGYYLPSRVEFLQPGQPPSLPESDAEAYDPDWEDWQLYQNNGATLRGFALAKGKSYTGGAIAIRVQELRRKFGA